MYQPIFLLELLSNYVRVCICFSKGQRGFVSSELVNHVLSYGRNGNGAEESDVERSQRICWVQRWVQYSEMCGSQHSAIPLVSKTPVDLFRLYRMVQHYGGLLPVRLRSRRVASRRVALRCVALRCVAFAIAWRESDQTDGAGASLTCVLLVHVVAQLMKQKKWRELAESLVGNNTSCAASSVRKLYLQYLFEYECADERGGVDPHPIMTQIENAMHDKRVRSEEARKRKREQREREKLAADAQPQTQTPDSAAAAAAAAAAPNATSANATLSVSLMTTSPLFSSHDAA